MSGSESCVHVRSLRPTDLPSARRMWQTDSCDDAVIARAIELTDRASIEGEGSLGFVAEVAATAGAETEIVGIATAGPVAGTQNTWALYDLYVATKQRRRSVGTQLMTALIQTATARGARLYVMELSTKPDSMPIVGLLRRFGFTEEAKVPDLFSDGVDLVVYRLARS
jgi:ribosomal protein S18 acetylase RimI-like enzyme